MREIRFRAWDTVTGTWFVPVYEAYRGNLWDISISLHGQIIERTMEDPASMMQSGRWVLQQFTGLKDKNGEGRDVFEGDIFESIFKDCPDGYRIMGRETEVIKVPATVVFKFGKFMVELMHPKEKELMYSDLFAFLKNEEKVIIGNIHENPELL